MSGQTDAAHSEPVYSKIKEPSALPWWSSDLDKYIVPETRELLERYSNVPAQHVSAHVHDIRKKAWAVRSYPCTGIGLFLLPNINRSPAYADIIERLQNGAILLDVGSFVGHDLRRLVFDGAPPGSLRALDLVSHWNVGYELFRDRDRFSVEYTEADILDQNNGKVAGWKGTVDVISIFHVLHQWVWEDQVLVCKRLIDILAPKPGSQVVGCQIGNVNAFTWSMSGVNSPQFRHTPESFARLWDQVGEETGTRWDTQAWLRTWAEMRWYAEDLEWLDKNDRVIDFVVTRQ